MAGFLPFAGKNSIVEAVFGLQFAQVLTPLISSSFDALQREFIADFPKFEKIQMLQLNLGIPQQETAVPTSGGFNATRIKPDGKPARVFRGVNNTFSAHFYEYSHWEEAKSNALRFFERCFTILNAPAGQILITAVTLRFIDRFTYDGQADEASAKQLLKIDTQYVPKVVFDAKIPWHSNTAWSEPTLTSQSAQHQLFVQGAKDANSFIMIHHNINCNLFPFLSTVALDRSNKDRSLESILDAQHAANAAVLRNMLNDKMLDEISLRRDEK